MRTTLIFLLFFVFFSFLKIDSTYAGSIIAPICSANLFGICTQNSCPSGFQISKDSSTCTVPSQTTPPTPYCQENGLFGFCTNLTCGPNWTISKNSLSCNAVTITGGSGANSNPGNASQGSTIYYCNLNGVPQTDANICNQNCSTNLVFSKTVLGNGSTSTQNLPECSTIPIAPQGTNPQTFASCMANYEATGINYQAAYNQCQPPQCPTGQTWSYTTNTCDAFPGLL